MNISIQPGFVRTELRPWQVAAGVLFVALLAYTNATAAQSTGRVAKLTPVATQQTAPAPVPVPAAQPATPEQAHQAASDMRLESLGPGDMVRISVFRNPDLTTETRVSERGTIMFPLIGELPVTGLTPTQAGARIGDKLKQGRFVVNPEVTVSLMQVNSRQVSVLGNVNKPGRYPLDSATGKLTDLLAIAGGIAPTGSDQVTIVSTRDGRTTKQEIDLPAMIRAGNLAQNVELQPGDTIFVHRAPMVYIYGEVQKAGAYRVEPHMTVMQALAMGGGLTPRGTERGVRIHRRNGDGSVKQMDARLTDEVRTDDVIYVRESLF
ncbi:MAG TPA: polysaccharide export protein EpsE [Usitatibacter sp.]|nr:polysaccharide export protein EpsE [Usitatibacter sp.]